MKEPVRVLNIVTVSMSTVFFRGQLAFLNKNGFETALCASPGETLHAIAEETSGRAFEVPMQREISPLRDLVALWKLYRLIRAYRPTIVNASTPKAGLLGMLAARLARVPVRIYLLRGLRLETTRGIKRLVLGMAERLASACASRIVCECRSLQQQYVDLGLARSAKTTVLASGSCNGIDTTRFNAVETMRKKACDLREELGIAAGEPVIGFVGRLTRDKGVIELTAAFEKTLADFPHAWLLLVGDLESGDALPNATVQWLDNHPRVKRLPFVEDPRPCYASIDILAFPTHREGFGAVALEAAAMEVPVVGFKVTGVVDSVEDGATGTLVPLGYTEALAAAIARYLSDPQLIQKHGRAGRRRAFALFRREIVWQAWRDFYLQQIQNRYVGQSCQKGAIDT